MRPPEDRLFERYRHRHDARLLAKVFDRTAPALLRIARHTAPRRDLADDLLQQVFLVAIERADRWDPARGLFPWLVGILVHQAKLLKRRESRRPSLDRLPTDTQPPPAETAEARELQHAITTAVAELGDTYQPVLHLHLYHGLNAKEIAMALDRPAGSVRTQLVRGLERLRRALPVGLALGATAMAPALAAVRQVVVQHAGANAATFTAFGTSLMLFGSSIMKKLCLAVLTIVLVSFAVYPFLPMAGDDVAMPPTSSPEVAVSDPARPDVGEQSADLQRESAPAAGAFERETVAQRDAVLHVRVVAGPEADAPGLEGVWVHLHKDQMRRPGARRLGARTDASGEVHFDNVPTGPWRVQAHIGAEDAKQSVQLVSGEVRDIVLRSTSTRFVEVEVVDAAGRPVADAEVWSGLKVGGRIRPMQVNARRVGHTDSLGRAHVAAGRGEFVGARKRGYAASLSSPAESAGAETVVIVLRDGSGTLSGEVLYEDGKPAANATVQVSVAAAKHQYQPSLRNEDGRATAGPLSVLKHTDRHGHFAVPGLAPGTYNVWTDATSSRTAGATVTIEADERKHVRLAASKPAFVTGRVLRRDGTPAARLHIGVRVATEQKITHSGVVNRDGTFTFKVPRGPVRIRIWRDPGEPLLEVDAMATALAKPIMLTVDDALSVSGALLAQDGSPIRGWIIGVLARGVEVTEESVYDAMTQGSMARSGEDGSFVLYGCGEGPFTVIARPVLAAVTGPAPVRRQNVPAGTVGLDLRVPESALERATLRVRVVDRSGAPIDGARVQLFAGRGPRDLMSTAGTFSRERLVHGAYRLEAHAPGHAGLTLRFTIDSAQADLGDIVLKPSALLRVRPMLDGKPWRGPLPQPIVHDAATGEQIEPQPTSTTVEGVLVLDGLPPGRFVLRTDTHDALLGKPVLVRLLPGPAVRVDWPLRIGRELTLRFAAQAKDPADAQVNVTIRDDNGDLLLKRELAPQPDGAGFMLQHVFAPGSYAVEARRDDGQQWRWSLQTVRWRNGSTVDVPTPR